MLIELKIGLDGIADQEYDRGWADVGGAEFFEGGCCNLLVAGRGFADRDAGGAGGDAGVHQVFGEGGEVTAWHVDDEGGVLGEGT